MIGSLRFFKLLSFSILMSLTASYAQTETNYVDDKAYKIIDDGAWCWFQDERVVIDTIKGKMIVGTANMQRGVDLTIFDIETRKVESTKRFTLPSSYYPDDHNSPGILIAPNGNYIAMWAHHYDKYNTRYSIHNGNNWSSEKHFDWNTIPGGTNYTICYSNMYYLSAEKRIYDFARAHNRAPNFIYSDNNGETWKYGGQLTTNEITGYNKGYYKYWGNGVDRIDFVLTEAHPREMGTSMYHGYIKDHKVHDSKGKILDNDVYDNSKIPTDDNFTKVFANGTKVNGYSMVHCWESDIVGYDDSTIAILFFARANNDTLDHRNFYARFDGTEWRVTYLGKAGKGFYASEQDYTGLGALCPDNPNRIYLSSPYNPGDDNSKAGKREIWQGTTEDKGATWKWKAITANSSIDNFRPIVPKWVAGKEALLWFRGTYTTAQKINSEVVCTIQEDKTDARVPDSKTTLLDFSNLKIVNNTREHSVTILYPVTGHNQIQMKVITVDGKIIQTRMKKQELSDVAVVDWNTSNLPAGIYLLWFASGKNSIMQKIAIHK
ncbi:MAG: BNR-4 repeat-containing protein [Chitinispirillaceae bacterium]|nr:BNR-4 repeat-containing protein [Chitinispirillaceae bacterium]